jgi:RHS repeat-associated protein
VYNASDVLVATISYRYNDQGYRTEKDIYEVATNTTQTITYTLSGDKVLDESDGTYQLVYTYDYDGTIIRFYYDANSGDSVSGADYFYLRNQQGDITTIIDNGGNTVVKYRYDAYGNILGLVDNSTGDIISKMNPYTYRGYRYDSEIGYYYLNSRYYNPEIGRFINADGIEYLGANEDILSYNLYAYCSNNPVMNVDPSGNFVLSFIVSLAIGTSFGAICGLVNGLASGNTENLLEYIAIGVAVGGFTSLAVSTLGFGYAVVSSFALGAGGDFATQLWAEERTFDEVKWGRVVLSGVVNTMLAGSGRQINAMTKTLWNVSKTSYVAAQVILNGSITAMGVGYGAVIGYYYRDRISNSNEMILQAG